MQGSSRMDTLGCGYNASWSLPGGKETEEDVETFRPAPDAIKATTGDRQAELARLEGERPRGRWPQRVGALACRCTGLTAPHPVRGRQGQQGEVRN